MRVRGVSKRRFSHSLIDTYLDCPKKAMYRYVENTPSPKTAALVKGSACDEGWNLYLSHKQETGEPLPLEELLEVVEESYRSDVRAQGGVDSVDWGDSNARATLDSTLDIATTWHAEIGPQITPTAVQVELHRELPSGRDFVGFLDWEGVVDGSEVIGDNKTGKRRMAQGDADKGLQPFAYAWLKDESISFVFARAIDTGRNQYSELVWTGRSQADVEWYGQIVQQVERAFDEGIFPANPRSNLCGPKWCPYYERCMPHRVISTPSNRETTETENS